MAKLKLLSIRKSEKSNYYCFELKEEVPQILKSAILELVKTFPGTKKETRAGMGIIENWFAIIDEYGERTEKLIPLKNLFDKHFSFENDILTIDTIFSQNKAHIIIGTEKNIQEKISKIFEKYIQP